jgi:hypothetical protein
MHKAGIVFSLLIALGLATGCLVRHPSGYDIGALGVNFSRGESRDFMSSYSHGVARADPATFVPLTVSSPWFGKDKERVYFEQFEIKGADPATFRLLRENPVFGSSYSVDKDSVFYEHMKLEGADPATIDISNAPFVTDGQRVYNRQALIPGAKWPLEHVRGVGMIKDASGAYFASKRRQGAGDSYATLFETYYVQFTPCDPATYPMPDARAVTQNMDSQCAYYGSERIPLTDRASFEFLDRGWSRDSSAVFLHAQRVVGADPATAEVVHSMSARMNPDNYFDRTQGQYFLRDRNGCWRDATRPPEPCMPDTTPVRFPGK